MKHKALYIVILTMLLLGCRVRRIQVPVEVKENRSRTEYKTLYVRDSIFTADTVYKDRMGDTIYIYKTRYVYKANNHTDTILSHDTLYMEKPITIMNTEYRTNYKLIGIVSIIGFILGFLLRFLLKFLFFK